MVVNACDSSTEEAQTGDPCSSLTSQPCLTVSSGVARDPAHLKKIGLARGLSRQSAGPAVYTGDACRSTSCPLTITCTPPQTETSLVPITARSLSNLLSQRSVFSF